MTKEIQIGIIGGGIGGVILARALLERGFDCHIFEQAPAFGEIGAGVQVTPNAVKVLKALGLGQSLADVGFLPEAMVGRDWQTSDELFRSPLKAVTRDAFGAEFYHVHRADLHTILTKDIPPEKVSFGTQCTGVSENGDKSIAHFSDGSSYKADLIVGADGIRSPVRQSLWGDDDPAFTGHMCWRALVPVDQHPLPFVGPDAAFWMGPNAHVVSYYVKGGKAVNIVAVKETADWVEESWTERSSTEELLTAYQGWHSDLIRLFEMTDPTQTFKWGLFDRNPMTRWSTKHCTLLGDAAHPMLPFLSQGAAMAIEDAYVLAESLDHFSNDMSAALSAYEAERIPRTSDVLLGARERGRSYHLSTPEELRKRNEAFREAKKKDPNAVGIRAEWIYNYDATSCFERFDSGG